MIFEDLAMPDGAEYFGQMPDFVIRRIVSHYYAMRREARRAPILVTTAAMFNKRNAIVNSEILDISRLVVIELW